MRKGDLFATIADETTARQLKQARADLQAARQRAELPLPSSEPLKVAEDSLKRLERLTSLSNVPAVEFEKAKSEVARLQGQLESERIERDRNLESLEEAAQEARSADEEFRDPFTDGRPAHRDESDRRRSRLGRRSSSSPSPSQQNYVRGEVNEEDVGEVKLGMTAMLQVYAFRARQFSGKVTAIIPAADPETQRYTIMLELENPPENLLAGMTGEMNIITGRRENVLLIPTRALLVDQALVVKGGFVQARTVRIGYRTLDAAEAIEGLAEGERVIISDQDRFRPGQPARDRVVAPPPETTARVTPPLYIALRFLLHRKRAFLLSLSRRRLRRRDFHLLAGADPGLRAAIHQLDARQQRLVSLALALSAARQRAAGAAEDDVAASERHASALPRRRHERARDHAREPTVFGCRRCVAGLARHVERALRL